MFHKEETGSLTLTYPYIYTYTHTYTTELSNKPHRGRVSIHRGEAGCL